MKIYGDIYSGNCFKLKLLCNLLDIDHEWIPIDVVAGDTRQEQFVKLNPASQIPVCVTDDGQVLTESNAILYYLGRDSAFWPADLLSQTRVLEWQFFEQYTHEPTIAVARFIKAFQGMPEHRREEYEARLKGGYRALDLMEKRLDGRTYLVGESCTLADITLFAYTHVAEEGGFDLASYPAVRGWIATIEALPGYTPMPAIAERTSAGAH